MSARVLRPDRFFDGVTLHAPNDLALIIAEGRIQEIVPARKLDQEPERLHGLLAPGLIDLQVNGGGDVLLNTDPSLTGLRRVAEAHARYGTTGFLATFITDVPDRLPRALEAVAQARRQNLPGLLGVHLEGPWLNPQKSGAHPAHYIRPMTDEDEALLLRVAESGACGEILVTLAPEIVPCERMARLSRAGIHLSAGHTQATPEELEPAIAAGLRGITHLHNAMAPIRDGRHPGTVGMALAEDRLTCGLIADGIHLHPRNLQLAYKAKGAGRLCLVSDAMPPVGGQKSHFDLFGNRIERQGRMLCDSHGRLAGACLALAETLPIMAGATGASISDILTMAAVTPARFLGLERDYGHLCTGAVADMILIKDDFSPEKIWQGGKIVA